MSSWPGVARRNHGYDVRVTRDSSVQLLSVGVSHPIWRVIGRVQEKKGGRLFRKFKELHLLEAALKCHGKLGGTRKLGSRKGRARRRGRLLLGNMIYKPRYFYGDQKKEAGFFRRMLRLQRVCRRIFINAGLCRRF